MQIRSAAKILIRRRHDGKYLILTSSLWEQNPDRSQQPDLPGGLAEAGETITEGLQREISEEIGIDVLEKDMQLVFANAFIDNKLQQSTAFLIYFIEVDDIDVELSWEHESFKWMSAEEISRLVIRQPYPVIFDYLRTVGILVD